MKNFEDLTKDEKSVLVMAYFTLNKSLHSHQPREKILKKIIDMNPKIHIFNIH